MQNDTPDPEKTVPPNSDTDGDRTVIAGAVTPPTQDDDDDRTMLAENLPSDDESQMEEAEDGISTPPDADEITAPPTGIATPPVGDVPASDGTVIASPPAAPASDETDIATPPVTDATEVDEIAEPPTPPVDDDRTQLAEAPSPEAGPDPSMAPESETEESAAAAGDEVPVVEDEPPIAGAENTEDSAAPEHLPQEVSAPKAVEQSSSADSGPVPVGTMINNNYEIKELISAGGMGEVFRGENAFTGDAVAIKIVLQSLANDPKIAALFMREAKVLCGLSDNAIVRYFNFVKDSDLDRFCLIMEFIDGVSLSDFVREERPLTQDEAKGLMRRVASGLDRAHKMDVVHRDLSPDNVMLRDGKVSEAVLIDFGIAKSTEMAENTLHGQLAGKFKYISPEQLGHFGGEIGPRTDIYGLGLLMAAALRGEPLDMGASVVEAVNARREIPDLSDIPDGMRPLLAHMLEPDPAHRPARMSDVIRLLDHPADIPAKYGGVRPVADGQTQPPTGVRPAGIATPGLRQPPTQSGQTTGVQQTAGASSMVPGGADAHSGSPFGTTGLAPGTFAPGVQTAVPPPGQQTMAGAPSRRRDTDGGGGFFRWVLILLVIIGIGGFVGWRQGLIPDEYLPESLRTADNGGGDSQTDDEVTDTPNGPMTRSSFLANFAGESCAFATRIATGRDAGTVEAFAPSADVYAGLADGFEAAFDTRPTIRNRTVPTTHCAALDMAKTLALTPGSAPVLTLDSNEMQSGGSIVGRLSDRRGRPVWLVLITAAGGVYNLTDRLTEQADGSATFSFGLNSDGSGAAQPQLLMAVAADQPLIAAAAANNGARASDLLPLIEAEIVGRNGEAGAALGYFDLLP